MTKLDSILKSRDTGVSTLGEGLAFCFRELCEGAVPQLWEPLGMPSELCLLVHDPRYLFSLIFT